MSEPTCHPRFRIGCTAVLNRQKVLLAAALTEFADAIATGLPILSPALLMGFQKDCEALQARLAAIHIDIENPLTELEIADISSALHGASAELLPAITEMLAALGSPNRNQSGR
jgi:hypothetical protein